jgi:hypothetical protein
MGENSTSSPRPATLKQILSLDGGGVRGAFSVAFLERMESIYRGQPGARESVLLADHFDLIGGTSTGAIIGTSLALGRTAREIKDFYFQLTPRVFRRSRWRIAGLQARFDSRALQQEILRVIGDRTLETADLRTRLAIVMKRMDTGSAWVVSSNPNSRYWNDPADGSFIGNRHFRLASLVRASTAAPYYFAPEEISIVAAHTPGLFVDGGVSPHNNPALALLQVATIPAYGFSWPTGADRLRIISIGTGSFRSRLDPLAARRMTAAGLAAKALMTLVSDGSTQALTLMQILGRTHTPWTINTEVGDLRGVLLSSEPLFTFERYDVVLERDWLLDELGLSFAESRVEQLREMDRPENVPALYEIGQAAAEKFMKPQHLAYEQGHER